MRFSGPLVGLCVPLLALLMGARSAAAQDACPEGPISFIFIDNHSIFDPDDLREGQPFLWVYRLANSVHMRTRESFIRSIQQGTPSPCGAKEGFAATVAALKANEAALANGRIDVRPEDYAF